MSKRVRVQHSKKPQRYQRVRSSDAIAWVSSAKTHWRKRSPLIRLPVHHAPHEQGHTVHESRADVLIQRKLHETHPSPDYTAAPEHIQAAKIVHRGEAHVGLSHNDAYAAAAAKHGITVTQAQSETSPDLEGFATSHGRTVDRTEGFLIAQRAGQLKGHGAEHRQGGKLSSQMVWGAEGFDGQRPKAWDRKIERGVRNWPRARGRRQ